MKGVVHVIEAILVSLIMLVSIPFLLEPGIREDEWDRMDLKYLGEDLLATLDRTDVGSDGESSLQDIMEKTSFEIEEEIFEISQRTGTNYGIRTIGSVKNEIRVACNCTEQERIDLQNVLATASFNDRTIVFRVFEIRYSDLSTLDFDVIVVGSSSQLSSLESFYQSSPGLVHGHLAKGHGIVEFIELNDPSTDLQSEIFNLTSGPSGSGTIEFENREEPSMKNYYIGKYFYGVGMSLNYTQSDSSDLEIRGESFKSRVNRDVNGNMNSIWIDLNGDNVEDPLNETMEEGDNFTIAFDDGVDQVYDIERMDSSRQFVYANINSSDEYEFHDFSNGGVDPDGGTGRVVAGSGSENALILAENHGGRTAWLADDDSEDVRGLLRSTIIWAAGEGWGNVVRTTSSPQSGISYIVSQGEEVYEPYIVQMTLWRLF